ncbi:MAG TPA: alpha/beta fold hydrolase [Luteolibacter sp.]|nr:alpha/beta fold hydrolase [Luteolibacter sp.]
MIRSSKTGDEFCEAGPLECWCLHGNLGLPADWRAVAEQLAAQGISSRSPDLWRLLECEPLPLASFGRTLNAQVASRRGGTALVGYSMGGRLALHALLEPAHPWQAAIIIAAHPGLEDPEERAHRSAHDARRAAEALTTPWVSFVETWDQQPLLQGGPARDAASPARLQLRRREIARAFVDWSLGAQAPLWERLGEISIPVLWVVGEADEKFRELGQRACGLLPNARLAIAPGCGHRVPAEAPEWLASTVAGFLRSGS